MPSVIGLDCSLSCTGLAILYPDQPARVLCHKSDSKRPLDHRLHGLYAWLKLELLNEKPVGVFIERPFEHGKGPSAWKNGTPLAMALLLVSQRRWDWSFIAPMQRAKYATGKGNAGKDEVLAAAIRKFGYQGSSNDEADALVIAYLGLELLPEGVGFDPYEGWPSVTKPALELVESMKLADAATP